MQQIRTKFDLGEREAWRVIAAPSLDRIARAPATSRPLGAVHAPSTTPGGERLAMLRGRHRLEVVAGSMRAVAVTRPALWRLAKRDGATSKELGAVLAVLGGGRLSAMRRPHLSPGNQGLARVDHNRLRSSRIRADRARDSAARSLSRFAS